MQHYFIYDIKPEIQKHAATRISLMIKYLIYSLSGLIITNVLTSYYNNTSYNSL